MALAVLDVLRNGGSQMTLLDAPQYDLARAHRRRNLSIAAVVGVVVLAFLTFWFWNWPAEHRVNRFFAAIEAKDMPLAYGIWNNDPDWQKHPEQYSKYNYGTFQVDWGQSSDWGQITAHRILMSKRTGSGTVVGVELNGRKTPTFLWVEGKTKQLGFSPVELEY
jgi:hypothetical protein